MGPIHRFVEIHFRHIIVDHYIGYSSDDARDTGQGQDIHSSAKRTLGVTSVVL
jgi:hypothetical protein